MTTRLCVATLMLAATALLPAAVIGAECRDQGDCAELLAGLTKADDATAHRPAGVWRGGPADLSVGGDLPVGHETRVAPGDDLRPPPPAVELHPVVGIALINGEPMPGLSAPPVSAPPPMAPPPAAPPPSNAGGGFPVPFTFPTFPFGGGN